MNILGFLLSEGEAPSAETTEEYLEMVDKMVHFVTNDVELFAGLVQSLEDDDDAQLSIEDLDDEDGKGYKYL